MKRKGYLTAAAALLAVLAVGRILATYRSTSQLYDEPFHMACGIEWLDRGTYTLDPLHPPLSRIAIALPLYLAGVHYPKFNASDSTLVQDYWSVGHSILYDDGHYLRNLALARSGVLPFMLLAALVVFLWTQRLFGDLAALMAVALFTTLPIVLAFSGVAYSDLPSAAVQFAALFVFSLWLEEPSKARTTILGIATGLALMSKFTTLLFLPPAAGAMALCKWSLRRKEALGQTTPPSKWLSKSLVAVLLACFILWAGYRFSVEPVREGMQLQSVPSFQHFPGPVRSLAQAVVMRDPMVPAPALFKGIASAWAVNGTPAPSYLFAKLRNGGWWYFFLAAIGVKTPLPFILLSIVGLFCCFGLLPNRQWSAFAPAASLLAILLVTTSVKYDAGLRHVLIVFPLLAILAGYGAAKLLPIERGLATWGHVLLAALLLWQGVESTRARSDYIAYFNELAQPDPSRVLMTGCDLDCGQDLFRLSNALHQRRIDHVSMAVWTSADLARMNLPKVSILQPFQPATGWVAIGIRSLRLGDVGRQTYPGGAFAWLSAYRPVEQVGKTISLYYIPEAPEMARRGGVTANGESPYFTPKSGW